ncbi:MAG: zf-HC2 domain-containing protein [Anaerolineae bacterium]|nr:zf-HC2 domain-containing protein [Anaerolineae bacterium]
MTNLLKQLRQLLQQHKTKTQEQNMVSSAPNNPEPIENREHEPDNSTALNATIVKNLMEMLNHTYEGMYSCEEAFALLDEYVELIADDEDAVVLMPYVKRHLDKCPNCHDVYTTLLNIIQSEPPAMETAN